MAPLIRYLQTTTRAIDGQVLGTYLTGDGLRFISMSDMETMAVETLVGND
jgi:hypothetical protein